MLPLLLPLSVSPSLNCSKFAYECSWECRLHNLSATRACTSNKHTIRIDRLPVRVDRFAGVYCTDIVCVLAVSFFSLCTVQVRVITPPPPHLPPLLFARLCGFVLGLGHLLPRVQEDFAAADHAQVHRAAPRGAGPSECSGLAACSARHVQVRKTGRLHTVLTHKLQVLGGIIGTRSRRRKSTWFTLVG